MPKKRQHRYGIYGAQEIIGKPKDLYMTKVYTYSPVLLVPADFC